MPSNDTPENQARSLISSVLFLAPLVGLLLAVAFGLVLHFGFGVGYDRMFQLIFYAFRR
jgi:nitrate reductase NapE component